VEGRMISDMPVASQVEIQSLRELTERVGTNPLLTQASTGNTSIKLDGVLWIKASGRWMADALQDDILIPVALSDVREGACNVTSTRRSDTPARHWKRLCTPYCPTG